MVSSVSCDWVFCSALRGERLVEEMKGYAEKAEERRDNLKKKLDDETHLVVDIQLAVSTLYQKLWNVKLKPVL